MGNTLLPPIGSPFAPGDRAVRPHDRTEMAPSSPLRVAPIQHAELNRAKVHGPAVVVDLLQPYELAVETVGEVPLGRVEGDDAVRIDALDGKCGGYSSGGSRAGYSRREG